jgi:queuine/archaeosine tRNA-ribosyltransferase
MLHDIAMVLRLTKQIKQEILRDQAAEDYETIMANRAKACQQLPDMD